MKKLTFCFLLLLGGILNAQVNVDNTTRTPAQLVQNVLVGQGVTPLNIKFNGSAANANLVRDQASYFKVNFNPTNLDFPSQSEGVLLTTGKGTFALGPNTSHNNLMTGQMPSTTANGSDPDLVLLSGNSISSSAILEFDFLATGLELNFDFIFGSEEYAGYVNSINDSFGFFLSGPGITGIYSNNAKNIALVPNTNIPVSINTINNGLNNNGSCVNCSYYHNNGPTGMNPNTSTIETVEYDGFTTVLQAKSSLRCGQMYHIKLAIGNVSDNLLDSGVFLKNFSIKPMQLMDNLNLSQNTGICNGNEVTIDSGLTNSAYEYEWTTVVGTQSTVITDTAGVPVNSPTLTLNQVTVPPAVSAVNYPFWVTETPQTYQLNVYVTYPPSPTSPGYRCMFASDTIVLGYLPKIPLLVNTPIDKVQCTLSPPPYVTDLDQEADIILGAVNVPSYIVNFYSTNIDDALSGGASGSIMRDNVSGIWSYIINDTNPHTIWIRLENILTGCVRVEPISYNFTPAPSGTISYAGNPYCSNLNTVQPITTSVTSGGSYSATPAGLNIDSETGAVNPSLSVPGNYVVNYTLAASGNCPAFSPLVPANIIIGASPPTPVLTVIQPSCTVNTGILTITSPLGVALEYSIDNGITFQTNPLFLGVPSGVAYNALVRNATSQCTSAVVSGIMNPVLGVPNAPVASATTQPNCMVPTGTITITGPLSPSFQYSDNGGISYQSGLTFSGLTPNITYSLTVRDMVTGCVSSGTPVTVNPIPASPLAPTASVTQPTCVAISGINITAPLGANLEYSINAGANYQAGTSFSGLAPNTYSIIVKDMITGCVSAASSFVINPIPANPLVPTFTIVQPSCSVNTGSFTVVSSVGATIEYSIDGGANYQAGTSFSSLAAGISYNVIARNTATGCVSTAGTANISPALTVPTAPIASTTIQPTCAAPTGTIEITAPLGGNLQYSVNGLNYQSGMTFSGLSPNTTFSITVKNTTSGCISAATMVAVNALPSGPNAPTASATTQPNCIVTTGTFTITSPLGSSLQYSGNGGISYQSGPTFSGLAPNTTFLITVLDMATGCVSLGTPVTVNPIPASPLAPSANVTQPSCIITTGSITITSPIGTDLLYSINNGTSYQAGPIFTNLVANATYAGKVKNSITGCTSIVTSIIINPAIPPPSTLIATGSNVCAGQSIVLNTPTVSGATYHWTGPDGFVSFVQNPIIMNATAEMSGVYNVVISITSDCPSLPGMVAITVNPLPIPALQNGSVCIDGQTQTVLNPYTLDSGLGNLLYNFKWFEISNNIYTLIPLAVQSTFTVSTAGMYAVSATNINTGCSDSATANVLLSPTPEQIQVDVSDYFSDLSTITTHVSPQGDYQYQLDNGAYQSSNVFTNIAAGPHKVNIKSECGFFSKDVFIMDYPKFFTPNGDGYNDRWNIFDLNSQANAKIYIFDRFGKFLKEISPSGTGWDGTYNQHSLPATDYWFIVHYDENHISKIFKSHFALKR